MESGANKKNILFIMSSCQLGKLALTGQTSAFLTKQTLMNLIHNVVAIIGSL